MVLIECVELIGDVVLSVDCLVVSVNLLRLADHNPPRGKHAQVPPLGLQKPKPNSCRGEPDRAKSIVEM